MPRRKFAKNGPARKVGRRGRGRPVVHGEPWTKVTVVLFNRQIVSLSRLLTNMRSRTGAILNRTEVIRALIDALIESGTDMTNAASEADLKHRLLRRLSS